MAEWKPDPKVLERMFRDIETTTPDMNDKIILYKDKFYSVNDVKREVIEGTEFGRINYEAYVALDRE